MRAWWWWPTAPTTPRAGSSACSPTTPASASCVTPMPDTPKPSRTRPPRHRPATPSPRVSACDGAVVHASELVVGRAPGSPVLGAGLVLERYVDGAVAWSDGRVVAVGATPDVLGAWSPAETLDAA